jgi:hypothetical protein
MAVQTITYEDKQYLNQNADIPATNKVQDTDMNEIKSVVNNNATELINLQSTVLYNSEKPNRGTVTLNDDYTNYTYLEIIGVGADGGMVSTKVKTSNLPGGATINLVGTSFRENQTSLCLWVSTLSATNSTTLTPQTTKWVYLTANAQGISDGNYMGVLTVLGYK